MRTEPDHSSEDIILLFFRCHSALDVKVSHIVPIARLEAFRPLKASKLEAFRGLKPYSQIGGF